MDTYFETETDVTQNLIDDFLIVTLTVRGLSIGRVLSEKKGGVGGRGGTGFLSEKKEALYAEFNERAEAATSSYSTTSNILQYIYSGFLAKSGQKNQSECLVHKFSFTDIFLRC